jgi:AcrR family transcriptional regulator
MSVEDLQWVRAPVQARSRATLDRILDATEKLLEIRTFDQLSVQDICKEAASSVGAFYTRFPDKIALLHLLHERICEEAKATAQLALDVERWRGQNMQDIVAAIVGFMAAEYGQRMGLRRELVRRNGTDDAFRARSVALAALTVGKVAVLLDAHGSEHNRTDTALAADMLNRLVLGVLDQAAQYRETGPAGTVLSVDKLSAELVRAARCYLMAP